MMLLLFRDIARFGYNHGSAIIVLILPYIALLLAFKMVMVTWGQQQWLWEAARVSLLLALYPLYLGRVIKYLAWRAGPSHETPQQLSINAQEWRRLFLVNIMVTALFSCGLLLLLLPGIYLLARLAFAEFITLLRSTEPVLSLTKSWHETDSHLGSLFAGALLIWLPFTLLELGLQINAEAILPVRLVIGLATELLGVGYTLLLITFFFRVYCLKASIL